MPGEIKHFVKIPVTIELTEATYRALDALSRAEQMSLDEEVASLITWGINSAIECCDEMPKGEQATLLEMLAKD